MTALGRFLGRDYYLTLEESIGDFLSTPNPKVRFDRLVLGAQCSSLERMRLADALESRRLHLLIFVFASPDRIFLPDPIGKFKVQGFFRKPREILKLAEALRRALGPAREGLGAPINDARRGMVADAIKYIEQFEVGRDEPAFTSTKQSLSHRSSRCFRRDVICALISNRLRGTLQPGEYRHVTQKRISRQSRECSIRGAWPFRKPGQPTSQY